LQYILGFGVNFKTVFMKLIHLLALALPLNLHAQDTIKKQVAIGLVQEANRMYQGNGTPYISTVGLQFRKNYKRNFSYSALLGYSHYLVVPQRNFSYIKGDTAYARSETSNIGMAVLGLGLEAERHFYKKVHFFAGLELRGGYGGGTTDTVITRQYNAVHTSSGSVYTYIASDERHVKGADESLVYAAVTPYVGGKIELKKFSFGLSFMNSLYLRLTQPEGHPSLGLLDFDLSNVTKRLFILYKF
jgi:hypothetical protein